MASFQAGLALTALVLAGVRFERSFFELRSARAESSGFSWTRWYHLVVMWGLALFVLPFVLGVAFPARVVEISSQLDSAVGVVEATREDNAMGPASFAVSRRESLRALLVALGTAAVIAGLGAGASFGRKRRRPGLMAAMSIGAVTASIAGLALAGQMASGLAGVPMARRTVEQYATANPDDDLTIEGPVAVKAVPEAATLTSGGRFFDDTLAGSAAGPYGGFRIGPYLVGAHGPDGIHVVKPHVRLGPEGREVYIASDEEVVVHGYALDGEIVPRPGYPVVVAPANAVGVLDELGAGLFGTESRRSRYLLAFQLALIAIGAWHIAGLGAALCERLLRRRVAATRAVGQEPADG